MDALSGHSIVESSFEFHMFFAFMVSHYKSVLRLLSAVVVFIDDVPLILPVLVDFVLLAERFLPLWLGLLAGTLVALVQDY
mmetsp:Transcript_1725/g.1181  ORF Transcript_1725/g.1181 Transcript_1725/m.1181 type:complete len:81 (-) Transcript_1725:1041-1283(-)